MKTLLLLLALLLCFYLAREKARSARSWMTHTNYPEMLVGPDQHILTLTQAILKG
ncbi:hypothetical protein H8S95_16990 [Pontibacter sp. KCTC 32443]|uniref:hypothetical protein n=1 Tax=Pontibacter TaxID=323449 RepID=UPI00164D0E09|nr:MULTISPECIES: hypothetical protein [Pontibacter]MBC5775773.1 hypothetical protein [Pontibacter sp. KCTC 32443]